MAMTEVDGRSAIAWTCPQCGRDKLAEMVAMEATDEDAEQQPELGEGEWVLAPATVKCGDCGVRYKLNYGDEPEDDG